MCRYLLIVKFKSGFINYSKLNASIAARSYGLSYKIKLRDKLLIIQL